VTDGPNTPLTDAKRRLMERLKTVDSATAPELAADPTQPQWDPARNAYIQWDPDGQRWMQYDDATQQWRPIS
jgi:hypothetical protein